MSLREYQIRAIAKTGDEFRAGKRAVLLVLPTGGGKTRTAAEIVRRHLAKVGALARVLWLAHRTELVEQGARALEDLGLEVGIIAASVDRPLNLAAPVQVASTQTLLARNVPLDPTLMVLDEAHHYPADDWSRVAERYPRAVRIGLSATPARENGAGLSPMFDALVVGATIRQLTTQGHLAPLDVIAPGRVLEPGQIAQRPVDAWLEHAAGRQAVVFAPHRKAASAFLADFEARGVSAAVVHGELAAATRARVLGEYELGLTRVLINVGILTEGWDHPPTGVAILARRCGSVVLFLQIAGRILRPHTTKARALFIDLTGAVHMHGRPDADRVFALEGRAIRRGEDAPPGSFCAVCGALFDAGSTSCIECGFARPEQEAPRVVAAPLKKLAADFLVHDEPDVIVARFAKWIREAVERGHNPRSAFHKFKACYRRGPTADEIVSAMRAARAARRGAE